MPVDTRSGRNNASQLLLGTDANEDHAPLYLHEEARTLGTYVIGTTGTGKSTFLKTAIMQDVYEARGLCVLDPHGDLVSDILACIPKHRTQDVILFDPSDIEWPFGVNLFACDRSDPRQRDLVTSNLMDTLFKLFYTSWGPRMEDLLRHSIQTLLHVPDSTFLELLLLLTNYEHRQRLKAPGCAADPILKHFWEQQFPESYPDKHNASKYKNPADQVDLVGSSLNKIGRFLVNPVIRNIIGQPKSSLNFRRMMDEGKILLVNLSKGDIGADNSSFLGSVLVNQLLLAALTRRELPFEKRRPFYLYVDEYQNFATESFPQLQSEARKFRIVTTVAHQYRDQLDLLNKGSTLNVANLVVFRVSGIDAGELAGQFDNTPNERPPSYQPMYGEVSGGVFVPVQTGGTGTTLYAEIPGMNEPYSDARLEMANILTTLPNRQGIIRIWDAESFQLQQYRLETLPFACEGADYSPFIREQSRRLYGRPVQEIEADIAKRMQSHVEHTPRPPQVPIIEREE